MQIKHRWTGLVLYECGACTTLRTKHTIARVVLPDSPAWDQRVVIHDTDGGLSHGQYRGMCGDKALVRRHAINRVQLMEVVKDERTQNT